MPLIVVAGFASADSNDSTDWVSIRNIVGESTGDRDGEIEGKVVGDLVGVPVGVPVGVSVGVVVGRSVVGTL